MDPQRFIIHLKTMNLHLILLRSMKLFEDHTDMLTNIDFYKENVISIKTNQTTMNVIFIP